MEREPVPVGRALIGCAALALVGIVAVLLVRPAIFSGVAPPRDDSVVTVGTAADAKAEGPQLVRVILSRPYGWDGERDSGDGHVELAVIVAPSSFGGFTAVAAASPVADDCEVEIGADRLVDCEGRAWSFDGLPLDPNDPPLDRFEVSVQSGALVIDFTRSIGG